MFGAPGPLLQVLAADNRQVVKVLDRVGVARALAHRVDPGLELGQVAVCVSHEVEQRIAAGREFGPPCNRNEHFPHGRGDEKRICRVFVMRDQYDRKSDAK
jgi:hypothetical protein